MRLEQCATPGCKDNIRDTWASKQGPCFKAVSNDWSGHRRQDVSKRSAGQTLERKRPPTLATPVAGVGHAARTRTVGERTPTPLTGKMRGANCDPPLLRKTCVGVSRGCCTTRERVGRTFPPRAGPSVLMPREQQVCTCMRSILSRLLIMRLGWEVGPTLIPTSVHSRE